MRLKAKSKRTGSDGATARRASVISITVARPFPRRSVRPRYREIRAVWVFTQSGSTARLVARHRPRVPIIAFTPNEHCYRRLALLWGTTPILTPTASSFRELENRVFPSAEERGLARPGDTVVMTGSHPFDAGSPTNFLKVHVVWTG